jgi:hypothetical protein
MFWSEPKTLTSVTKYDRVCHLIPLLKIKKNWKGVVVSQGPSYLCVGRTGNHSSNSRSSMSLHPSSSIIDHRLMVRLLCHFSPFHYDWLMLSQQIQ